MSDSMHPSNQPVESFNLQSQPITFADSPMLNGPEQSPSKEIDMDDSGIGLSLTYEEPSAMPKSMTNTLQQQQPHIEEINMMIATSNNDNIEAH
jgi:hypothetical protein